MKKNLSNWFYYLFMNNLQDLGVETSTFEQIEKEF